jgi:hypothetical protein
VPKKRYDVRSTDGRRFLFKVTEEEAARGIADNVFVLSHARSGVYLKRTADRRIDRYTAPRTWSGRAAAAAANTGALYTHNEKVCDQWKPKI